MRSFVYSVLLGLLLLFNHVAAASLSNTSSSTFKITGVDEEASLNIQHRLVELYRNQSLSSVPPETLKHQIERALQPFGFFKPQITLISQQPVSIHIIPGPPLRITALTVQLEGEGADNVHIQHAKHTLPITQGSLFHSPRYEDAKEQLMNAAEQQGYLHAHFTQSTVWIDGTRERAKITLIFNTGPQFYYGHIRFNPTRIDPQLLKRYIPFQYGAPYSTEGILALNNHLSASGYFKSVVVKPHIATQRHVPVELYLTPAKRLQYSFGAGFGTDTGPRGRAALAITPVNRHGHKFNAIAQGSLKQNTILAQYLIPGRNPLAENYSFSGSFSNLHYVAGRANSLLLSAAYQYALLSHQRILALNVLNERYRYTDSINPSTTQTLLFPRATLTWRQVTDQLFSPSGYNITLNGFVANRALFSDLSVAQATIDARAAFTLAPLKTRIYLHTIQGAMQINQVNQLPLSLAFLLGGAENMKAYSFNSIGPGKRVTYGGIQLQHEIINKWYLVGLYDAGDVYHPAPQATQYDVGGGLMWVSPVGPIKVALAQPVDGRLHRIQGTNPRLVINMGPDL